MGYLIYITNTELSDDYPDWELFSSPQSQSAGLLSGHIHLEENAAGSFEFTISPVHPFYNKINPRITRFVVYMKDTDETPTWCGFVTNVTFDFWMNKTVVCDGTLSYLNDSVQPQDKYSKVSVSEFLSALINEHNRKTGNYATMKFRMGNVDFTNKITRYTNFGTTWNEINDNLLDRIGGCIAVRYTGELNDLKQYIDYVKETSGDETDQTISFGQNLMDLSATLQAEDIVTAVIPLGKAFEDADDEHAYDSEKGYYVDDNLEWRRCLSPVANGVYGDFTKQYNYIYSTQAVQNLGWVWAVVTYDDITSRQTLKEEAMAYISNYQFANMVIEVTAVDLSMTNKEFDSFKLLDQVRIISAYHGMNATFRVTALDYYLEAPESNTVTLGHSSTRKLTSIINKSKKKRARTNIDGAIFIPNIQESDDGDAARDNITVSSDGSTLIFNSTVENPTKNGSTLEFKA